MAGGVSYSHESADVGADVGVGRRVVVLDGRVFELHVQVGDIGSCARDSSAMRVDDFPPRAPVGVLAGLGNCAQELEGGAVQLDEGRLGHAHLVGPVFLCVCARVCACARARVCVFVYVHHFLASAFHSMPVAYPGIITASRSPLRLKLAYAQSTFTECLEHPSFTWHGPQSTTFCFLLGDLAARP